MSNQHKQKIFAIRPAQEFKLRTLMHANDPQNSSGFVQYGLPGKLVSGGLFVGQCHNGFAQNGQLSAEVSQLIFLLFFNPYLTAEFPLNFILLDPIRRQDFELVLLKYYLNL
jgi:hypothetical protein